MIILFYNFELKIIITWTENNHENYKYYILMY